MRIMLRATPSAGWMLWIGLALIGAGCALDEGGDDQVRDRDGNDGSGIIFDDADVEADVDVERDATAEPTCEDGDADGVCNEVDRCPEVSDPDQTDTDEDGAGDACDGCPTDAAKTESGDCGCGRPDMPVDEICNDIDDDCDGEIDEDFDLDADASHCGACDRACEIPNAAGACVGGQCAVGACASGFVDLDGAAGNGCEYVCDAPGAETCDGFDNNCDGRIDEAFDLSVDPQHCGACNRRCEAPHANDICVDGECGFDTCDEGFIDLDGDIGNGCEYSCVVEEAEECNGRDDDCDGEVDEGFDLSSDIEHCGRCDHVCEAPNASNACVDGEDFDLLTDPQHCGQCGEICDAQNANNICAGGQCGFDDCDDGFVDLDGQAATGCEYACVATGPEICDGLDNDCDGAADEGGVCL